MKAGPMEQLQLALQRAENKECGFIPAFLGLSADECHTWTPRHYQALWDPVMANENVETLESWRKLLYRSADIPGIFLAQVNKPLGPLPPLLRSCL
jgi:hypothetical protein